jgi:hypothetical protein
MIQKMWMAAMGLGSLMAILLKWSDLIWRLDTRQLQERNFVASATQVFLEALFLIMTARYASRTFVAM